MLVNSFCNSLKDFRKFLTSLFHVSCKNILYKYFLQFSFQFWGENWVFTQVFYLKLLFLHFPIFFRNNSSTYHYAVIIFTFLNRVSQKWSLYSLVIKYETTSFPRLGRKKSQSVRRNVGLRILKSRNFLNFSESLNFSRTSTYPRVIKNYVHFFAIKPHFFILV